MRYVLGLGTTLTIACLIWVALQTSGPTAAADEADPAHFTFSAEANQRILVVRTWGGMSLEEYEYILWGDGRFQRIHSTAQGKRIFSEREAILEFIEMNDLVGLLVEGNLMEWDEEDIAIRIRQAISGDETIDRGGRLLAPTYSAWTKITINLDSYGSRSGKQLSPASITFSYIWSPRLFKKIFKPGIEVPEVDSLIALSGELVARFPVASNDAQPHPRYVRAF